ncbi:MAG: TonB-dependent receptor [Bacteroidetes bacterium]|uniref:TonB-dependent receptor n=1 Tax=Candidatus Cryptobacteroides faecavium TaxID=2840762 RepID=A0A9D9IE76_9BACT|nr:TonB-dependent receptor [Candidatus Cryptobacteroides faecavium]
MASDTDRQESSGIVPALQDGLRGVVTDMVTGEPLIGAGILIEGTTEGTVTDVDGSYVLALPEGTHSLSVSYIGYLTVNLTVTVNPDGTGTVRASDDTSISMTDSGLMIYMAPDSEALADAVVTARKNLESLQALQNERIQSGFAIENMGAREMSIKGISNAQESVAKLSGISIASAGQLIVRGLGDRYSTTTLNGLPIASPNPDNKLIPLDIFPASTIQNITVSKVYEASSFADYSGAHVDISTKEGQSENFFNVSFSTGGYFHTLGSSFYRMDGRSLFTTPRLDPTAENISYGDYPAYSRSHKMFKTTFQTSRRGVRPDLNGSFGWGRNFNVGDQTLSVLASASIKSGQETKTDAFYRTYEASSEGMMQSNYDYDSYSEKLDIAALVDIDYTLREHDNIGLTAFFARNASDTFLDRQGQDFHEGYDLVGVNQVSHFYMLQNYQLSGHHEIDDWNIDWGASYSLTSSDEPDRRQVMFSRGDDGSLHFFDLNQQETQRYFGSLAENELVADIKATWEINDQDRLRFGLTAKDKVRKFRTTRFYYDVKGLDESFPYEDRFDMDRYLDFSNVQSGLISITRSQSRRDRYDAENLIGAAFAETDLRLSPKWFLNAGLRFEASRQSVDYNDDVEDKTRNLDAFDLFPAVNLKYDLTDRSMFRLSLSRTVTRPSFVEMAPFLYQESFGGAQIRGNDELENGYNYNVDLKYEFFSRKNTDMFAVTAYFKYLEDPIERTQRLSGGATEHSFQNADNGVAAGLEAEFRKQIVKDLVFSANASYMYTNVILPEGGVYTNPRRSLQGASPYLANADLTYTPEFRNGDGLSLSLLYSLQGPRIHAVGIMGLGDVKQMPVHTLDFAGSYRFNEHFSVRLAFRNMLDSTIKFKQEIPDADRTVDVEQWRVGPGFEIGISYSL